MQRDSLDKLNWRRAPVLCWGDDVRISVHAILRTGF